MKDFTGIPDIGNKLRNIRLKRGFTLEKTSKLTGVSKTMLGQIERGESTPSISILWKISSGLKISLSDLFTYDIDTLDIVKIEEGEQIYEANKKVSLYTVFPFSPETGFELFAITMEPNAEYLSGPHENAKYEYIIVIKGELNLVYKGKQYDIKAPSALKFVPDSNHIYSNKKDKELIFHNIMQY